MTSCFITGIGTGIGKTFVMAALAHQLRQAGREFRALKPVISGFESMDDSDSAVLAQASGLPMTQSVIDSISPWRFKAPLSPHLAAEMEERAIIFDELVDWCREQIAQSGTTIIEGVGGLMVPLNREMLLIDWIAALDIPVFLVSGSYLGAINHTLLSLEVLQRWNIAVRGVIVSQSDNCCGLPATCDAIAAFAPSEMPLIPLQQVNSWKDAPDLLSLIV